MNLMTARKEVSGKQLPLHRGRGGGDYQLVVLPLRMEWTVIPTNKVNFILFSVHWLYIFSEKSAKEHHTRPETK